MKTIFEACRDGDLPELERIIFTGKNIDTKDNQYSGTPLQWAMMYARQTVVQYLLDLNINNGAYDLCMDHRDIYGKTAKDHAITHKKSGNPALLNALYAWKRKKFCAVFEANETPRKECSWTYLRTKMMKVDTHVIYDGDRVSDRYPVCSETLHAELTHHSRKTGALKWSLSMDKVHHQLRADLRGMENIDGNILAADITFEFKIDGTFEYQSVTFPIKILGRSMFTITDAHAFVKDSTTATITAYDILEPIYEAGKAASQCRGTHGQDPQYRSTNSSHQQFKNHSEQALIAYLATPAAGRQLVNRFINVLHEKGLPSNPSVKIYMVALHVHSDKTTCGACERVLVGVQNDSTRNDQARGQYFGFIEQLETAFLQRNDICQFRLPRHKDAVKKGGLRCYVTSSGEGNDATHKTLYGVHRASSEQSTIIETSTSAAANHLHMARFQPGASIPFYVGQGHTRLAARTFFSSASKDHIKTPSKEAKYKRLSSAEDEDFSGFFARMGLS